MEMDSLVRSVLSQSLAPNRSEAGCSEGVVNLADLLPAGVFLGSVTDINNLGQARFFQAVDLDGCEVTAVTAHRFGGSAGIIANGFESGDTSARSAVVGETP